VCVWRFFTVPHKFLNKYKSNWIRETYYDDRVLFIYIFFSCSSYIILYTYDNNIPQCHCRRWTRDVSAVCASGSIIPPPSHRHCCSDAGILCIYRAHTVYAVIANGRANNFLFPRSAHAIIYIILYYIIRIHLYRRTAFPLTPPPSQDVHSLRRTLL